MIKKVVYLILVGLIFSGCTIAPHKVSMQNKIDNKVDVISIIDQQELDALFPIQNSSGVSAQFGLIGALIGSAIDASANSTNAEKATNNLSPIRNKLIDYNFDEILQSNIESKLSEHPNLLLGEVKTFKDYNVAKKEMESGKHYLKLFTTYKLDLDFRTPFVVIYATLIKKGETDKKDTVVYKNTFTYFADSLPAPKKDNEAAKIEMVKLNSEVDALNYVDRKKKRNSIKFRNKIKVLKREEYTFDESVGVLANIWATSESEQLKNSLTASIGEIIVLLAEDMADSELPERYKDTGQALPSYPKHHKALFVKDGETRDVIRFTYGHRVGAICSMPNLGEEESKLVCL